MGLSLPTVYPGTRVCTPVSEQSPTVAVLGGGAVGTTAAFDLASGGAEVTLFERSRIGADHASTGRAAGVCYSAFPDRTNALLARRSLERFRSLSGTGGFSFHDVPYVWLARQGDRARATAIRDGVDRMRDHGLDVELIDPAWLSRRYPAIRTGDVAVAAVDHAAGCTDPATYAELLASRARRAGASIRERIAVALDRTDGTVLVDARRHTFDAVLVAAGAHTDRILTDAGHSIAMKPYRVQALTIDGGPALPMGYDATAGFYFRPHGDGVLVGDGTEKTTSDPDAWTLTADRSFEESALERLCSRVELEAPTIRNSWAGLCTATPDHNPLAGRLADDVYVATGWQGHGFMRAPAIGEQLARQILGEPGIDAFDPGRFPGDHVFKIEEGMALP